MPAPIQKYNNLFENPKTPNNGLNNIFGASFGTIDDIALSKNGRLNLT